MYDGDTPDQYFGRSIHLTHRHRMDDWPRRQPNRLEAYDYAAAGVYFVTICVRGRKPLLGRVRGDEVCISETGAMVQHEWLALPERFKGIELIEYIVMPDHVHGIVGLGVSQPSVPLGTIVGAFKSRTTVEYLRHAQDYDGSAAKGNLWQRGYYDHVIRNDHSLRMIREYVRTNPLRWSLRREGRS